MATVRKLYKKACYHLHDKQALFLFTRQLLLTQLKNGNFR